MPGYRKEQAVFIYLPTHTSVCLRSLWILTDKDKIGNEDRSAMEGRVLKASDDLHQYPRSGVE